MPALPSHRCAAIASQILIQSATMKRKDLQLQPGAAEKFTTRSSRRPPACVGSHCSNGAI
jgi:hypothetical protein